MSLNKINVPSEFAARAIAYYLPQYHPTKENNEWWGPGFTEWTNTAKARPLYKGHYQPHIPADLGYYDLRLPETRVAQTELAKAYGIHGFCYWHYWFGSGRRLLERPFSEVLASGEPDFPFCLGWANESWTGIWHGLSGRTLVQQNYPGNEDHRLHFDAIYPAFRDHRYIRVEGKPVFFIYRPDSLPEPKRAIDLWREMACKSGLGDLFVVAEHHDANWSPFSQGFDAFVHIPKLQKRRDWTPWSKPIEKVRGKFLDYLKRPTIIDHAEFSKKLVADVKSNNTCFPCTIPNWDNTPRSGHRGVVFEGSSPALFKDQIVRAVRNISSNTSEHKLIFIKSWNEWAEGNHLEPDQRFGHQYLQALKEGLSIES